MIDDQTTSSSSSLPICSVGVHRVCCPWLRGPQRCQPKGVAGPTIAPDIEEWGDEWIAWIETKFINTCDSIK